jgi:AraC-like DNA-binding protein
VEQKDKAEAERLSGLVLESLDQESGPEDLARKAYRSRSDFFRLFRALIDETPGTMRRRFLLERAAWQLGRTRLPVTEIAFDANYGSLEAFTRAFRRAFRVSPSLYRRMGVQDVYLPAPNGFHFHAPGSRSEGAYTMDLFDIFAGADSWHTRRLLEHAKELTDEQLDRPLKIATKVFPWETPDSNLRDILERIVQTKEVWTAAVTGRSINLEPAALAERTPARLLERFNTVDGEFQGLMTNVRDRSGWQDTFVDALCEPAETFTFGGMFAHMMTFNAYRRLTALSALRGFGVNVKGFGCPTEYETACGGGPRPAVLQDVG